MQKTITTLLLFVTVITQSQIVNTQKLDSFLTHLSQKNKAMGSLSIHKAGNEVYARSIGYADVAEKLLANSETKYRIGSITKTFTAALIMQLIDEGKLTLDTPLSTYFPQMPNADKITIEHLLRHRSGLFNITGDKDFRQWMLRPNTRAEMLDRMVEKEIQFKPNKKAKYSNTNYLLLGYILEDIENKSYAEILKSRIVMPCDLKNTSYGGKIDVANNEANSYVLHADWVAQPETDMSVPAAAGAIISTPKDVAIFYDRLFKGKLISDKSLDEMKRLVDRFGLGLMEFPYTDGENYGHSGGIDGFQSIAIYIPENELIITYLSNGVVLGLTDILMGVAKIYFGAPYEFPEFKPPLALKTEELDSYLGVYKANKFPHQIKITKEDTLLIVNAKNGPTFPVESYEKDVFKSDQTGVQIEFFPEQDKMVLHLGAKTTELIRE
ncbi:serine hydrolase domain-containing protein [Aquimarina spongiae]|uniref:D-alanyl-D-alanine carboxypeptidase n=1 Tax=Aquimarina spongiae TaxID=570521 RepID=A0A1M6G5T1_9FLAO|nr:serine hydrolase domain-containing protein [Aquimarina spongiae]SHJ05305.1 D-alanyl-D-alanine carboxypeptidase [Aquimarina spongiae]